MTRLYEAAGILNGLKTQTDIARALNASPQTIKNWETRGVSKQGMIDAQRVLGCSAAWIESGQGPMLIAAREPAGVYNVDPGPDIRGRVPLISWIQAGAWELIVDNFKVGEAEDWMPCPKKFGPNTFALRVRGISMQNPYGRPSYEDGDVIFVDPSVTPDHLRCVVVRLDDQQEATFKQLVIEGSQKFLRPLNPDWPGPKLIEINGNATICGVVIGKWVPE